MESRRSFGFCTVVFLVLALMEISSATLSPTGINFEGQSTFLTGSSPSHFLLLITASVHRKSMLFCNFSVVIVFIFGES
jgi:hypothetical protein